jgi:hypothetical protein
MEAEQLTLWRHARLGRWFLGLLPAVLLLSHEVDFAPARAEAVMSVEVVEVHALGSDPWPLAASATRSQSDIVLRAMVRFTNDCLAQAGFEPIYRDLASARLTGTRLLLLRARRAPQGCPDIYAPVVRPFVLRVPNAEGVRQVVLLDEVSGRQPAIVTPSETNDSPVGGEPVVPAGALPLLTKAEITPALDLRFQVTLPPGCSPRDVAIEMVEGRGVTASGESVTPVQLWVMVLTDRAACQANVAAGDETELAASLRSLVLRGRQLRLVNPLLPTGVPEPRLFTPLVLQ